VAAPGEAYDAENRLLSVDGGATASYAYDAEGRRVHEEVGGVVKEYLYAPVGQELSIVDANQNLLQGETYFGGRYLGTATPSWFNYAYADGQGTVRKRSNGELDSNWPFGEFANYQNGVSPIHFTGKLRDSETNLDYFGARYYSRQLGRWLTPDWSPAPTPIPYASLDNPQSLNLYSYVLNNPATATDPDGHCCDPITTAIDLATWAALHPQGTARIVKGAEGAGMMVGGVAGMLVSSGVGVVATPFTGGASDYAGALGAASGMGVALAGSVKVMAAIVGSKDPNLPAAESAAETMANPLAAAATVASKGNLKVGSAVNTISGAAGLAVDLANPGNLSAIQRAAAVANAVDVAVGAKKAICKEETLCGTSAGPKAVAIPAGGGN